jgi:hypothetical protein
MTPEDLKSKLRELMNLPAEKEWVEFKEAKNNFDSDDLGRYFSALSNEANLKGQPAGWLVFGVTNKAPRQVCGSNYRSQGSGLNSLKNEVAKGTNHQITSIEIHEVILPVERGQNGNCVNSLQKEIFKAVLTQLAGQEIQQNIAITKSYNCIKALPGGRALYKRTFGKQR